MDESESNMKPPAWLAQARERYRATGLLDKEMVRTVAAGGRPWLGISSGEQDYLAVHARRYLNTIAHLSDGHGRRLLDVGCYPGHLALLAVIKGWRVSGISPPPARLGDPAFADRMTAVGIDIRAADIEREPFPFDDAMFDAAFFNETIEHLAFNPFHPLAEIWRVLKPFGSLLFSVPNICSFDHRWAMMRGRSIHMPVEGSLRETFPADIAHRHIREYTPAEVRHLLDGQDKYLYRYDIERIVMDRSWDGMDCGPGGTVNPWRQIKPGIVARAIMTRLVKSLRGNIIAIARKPSAYVRLARAQIAGPGFYPAEMTGAHASFVRTPIRAAWTQEQAELRLPVAGLRVTAIDLLMILPAPVHLPPRDVTVTYEGRRLAMFALAPSVEPRRIRITLPTPTAGDSIALQFHVAPWKPADYGFPGDNRTLGVMIAVEEVALLPA